MAHVAFGDPVCHALAKVLADAVTTLNLSEVTLHRGGTYVCMEGPAFSTKAESNLYRSWSATVIGMTNLPEAKLAREAEMAYATLALVTDYDCWHPDHDSVTVEMVIGNLQKNAQNAQAVMRAAVRSLAQDPPPSAAHDALKYAVITPLDQAPAATLQKLALLLKKISVGGEGLGFRCWRWDFRGDRDEVWQLRKVFRNQDFIKSKFCRAGILPALGQPRRLSTLN